jgi:hypothetical protein
VPKSCSFLDGRCSTNYADVRVCTGPSAVFQSFGTGYPNDKCRTTIGA